MNTVTRYDIAGYVEDLPSLNEGRSSHGCGVYTVDSGDQVIVITYSSLYTIVVTNIVRYFSSPEELVSLATASPPQNC